jgi:hypothetical protein
MDTQELAVSALLAHLRGRDDPLTLPRHGPALRWSDEEVHRAAYAADPELYALLATVASVAPWQRVRVLYQLLSASREGLSTAVRRTLNRVAALLLVSLHPDHVLLVFLALRHARANHKHTARAVARYLLTHPCAGDMAARRRPAVVDALEHALGRNVARACAKMLAAGDTSAPYIRQHLLRFAPERGAVAEVVARLYRPTEAPPDAAEAPYTLVHGDYAALLAPSQERPATVTATNRGDIAATLVHFYRGGATPELRTALDSYVAAAADRRLGVDARLRRSRVLLPCAVGGPAACARTLLPRPARAHRRRLRADPHAGGDDRPGHGYSRRSHR